MDGICAVRPDLTRVRRIITRAPDAGGEAFEAVSDAEFTSRAARGEFALHWSAHGFSYGIPTSVHEVLTGGCDVLANLSRAMVGAAALEFDKLLVLHVTASNEILSQRLAARGREAGPDISRRLVRKVPAFPTNLRVHEIDNSGTLEASITAALAVIYPERS